MNKTKSKRLIASLLSALMLVTMMSLTAVSAPGNSFRPNNIIREGWIKNDFGTDTVDYYFYVSEGAKISNIPLGSDFHFLQATFSNPSVSERGELSVTFTSEFDGYLISNTEMSTKVNTTYWFKEEGGQIGIWIYVVDRATVAKFAGGNVAVPADEDAEVQESQVSAGSYVVNVRTRLNVRAGAGVLNARVGTLRRGDVVNVISITDGWAQIAYTDEVPIAYISARFINSLSD